MTNDAASPCSSLTPARIEFGKEDMRGSGWPSKIAICFSLFLTLQTAGALPPRQASESSQNASTNSLVITGPERVEDTMLRNGKFWGEWNYGSAPYLQVGVQPSTVYDIYRSVTLIRFDLAGLPSGRVESARLRLYVPRNQTQIKSVPLHVHAVSAANAGWREGTTQAQVEFESSSWNHRARGQTWAGEPGCSKSGVDYGSTPLDSQIADGLEGRWLEFQLPPLLVESWMTEPDGNAGLLIRTDDDAEPGQGTHICSSQHWSGNGPQLVIKGSFGPAKALASVHERRQFNPRYQLPPVGPLYQRWLNESDAHTDRYVLWARDKSINLAGDQRLFPYLWDISVKADILIPKATLPLSKITEEIPSVVARGDRPRARQIMDDCMKYLMVYDYGRDQIWYDSGPAADILSPLQVAKFFARDNESGKTGSRGIYSQYDDGRWDESSDQKARAELDAQLEEIKKQLHPTPAEFAKIEPVIASEMALERMHRTELKKCLGRVQKLIEQRNDGAEMLQALRGMFFHHRMFLIHQSLFSMPKYSVLLENGDAIGYAEWFYKKRVGQYNHERVGRQLAAATRYVWRPSSHQEAEYAAYKGGHWSNEVAGFSGTGYVKFDKNTEGRIEWDVDAEKSGLHQLAFRYCLPSATGETFRLAVGESSSAAMFEPTPTGKWATNAIGVRLALGHNHIVLSSSGSGGLELDYLDVRPMEPVGETKASTVRLDGGGPKASKNKLAAEPLSH